MIEREELPRTGGVRRAWTIGAAALAVVLMAACGSRAPARYAAAATDDLPAFRPIICALK